MLRLRALPDQTVELQQEREHLAGMEAVTVAGGVVHRVCGHEGPHAGVKGHDGADLDFVLPDRDDVLLSADEPHSPLKHYGCQLPPCFIGHGFRQVEVLRDEAGRELLDGNALPYVLDAAEGEAAPLAPGPSPDHGVPGPERRVDRLVAVGGAEGAASLLHLRAHEVADRGAERGPLQVRLLRVHKAFVDLPEAGDGKVVCAALLADKFHQEVRVLRECPDLSCAFDQNACRDGSLGRKRDPQRGIARRIGRNDRPLPKVRCFLPKVR